MKKKESTLPKLLRPDSSAIQRPQDGPSSPPRKAEGIVLPKLLNQRASYSDRYQALLFCLCARLSCGCPCLNKAALPFPPRPRPGAHALSLSFEKGSYFLPISGPKAATTLLLTLANSAPCLLTQKATVLQPVFFAFPLLLLPAWAALL